MKIKLFTLTFHNINLLPFTREMVLRLSGLERLNKNTDKISILKEIQFGQL